MASCQANAEQLTNALMQPLFRPTFVSTEKFRPPKGKVGSSNLPWDSI